MAIESIAYLQIIAKSASVNVFVQKGIFNNIICTEVDEETINVDKLSTGVQIDLFKIIAAPVPNIDELSYKKMASDFINKYSWGQYNVRFIISPKGGCLTIIDSCFIKSQIEKYKEEFEECDEDCSDNIHSYIIRDLCSNTEFAIMILLLKRMNFTYSYYNKIMNPKKFVAV